LTVSRPTGRRARIIQHLRTSVEKSSILAASSPSRFRCLHFAVRISNFFTISSAGQVLNKWSLTDHGRWPIVDQATVAADLFNAGMGV
jgi:hypothetical protein